MNSSQKQSTCDFTDNDVQRYIELFTESRVPDSYLERSKNGWVTKKNSWTKQAIVDHLSQNTIIGLFPDVSYDLLIFDIDNKDTGCSESPESRASKIIKAIYGDPLVYTSSDSGGLRLCYFLDQEYFREDIYAFGVRQLTRSGIDVRSGYVEIMANRKGDRLPFGKGSFVADPTTFEPYYDMSVTGRIDYAKSIRDRSPLVIDSVGTHRREKKLPKQEFGITVGYLEEYGLPFSVSTNEALLLLNRKQMGVLGRSCDDASRWLKSWIRNHHNGRSERVNAGRMQEIDDQIDRIVRAFDPSKYDRGALSSITLKMNLRLRDVERILELIPDRSLHQAAFSMLHWVLNRKLPVSCQDTAGTTARPYITNDIIRNNYLAQTADIWSCQIPKKSLRRFSGFQKNNPAKTVEQLTAIGLISLARGHSVAEHRCRTYYVSFTFDSQSQEVVSLDDAMDLLAQQNEAERIAKPQQLSLPRPELPSNE